MSRESITRGESMSGTAQKLEDPYQKGEICYHTFVDGEIQVNIGMLQSILGEDLYFELLEEMGKYEMDGRLTLPITDLEAANSLMRSR